MILLSPILLVLSIIIKLDSEGPVMFRQVRVTTYGKTFRIFKFRTVSYTHLDVYKRQVVVHARRSVLNKLESKDIKVVIDLRERDTSTGTVSYTHLRVKLIILIMRLLKHSFVKGRL